MENCPTILLIDDNADDVLLFRCALEQRPLHAELRVARGGLEAVKYLSGYGVFGNRAEFPMPAIVLLDLNMPEVNGLEVLRWIRRQDALAGLPVVVYTGSETAQAEAVAYGADAYVVKDSGPEELLVLIQQISLDWCGRSEARQLTAA